MTEEPRLGRRGFRDWAELLADLDAIAAAPDPFNRARVWRYDPRVGGVAPTGTLTVEPGEETVSLLIDGVAVATFARSEFRGAWSSRQGDEYSIDLDIGRRDPIQVGGRRSSARSVEPLR